MLRVSKRPNEKKMCEMRIEIWHVGKSCDGLSCLFIFFFFLPLNNNSTLFHSAAVTFADFFFVFINMIWVRKAHTFQGKQIIFCVSIAFISSFVNAANETHCWLLFVSFFCTFYDWLIYIVDGATSCDTFLLLC